MIQSIPMYGLLHFLFDCDGVIVWYGFWSRKKTVGRSAVVFAVYLSGDVWGVFEVIHFPQHICREFPTMTNVFRHNLHLL